MRQLPIRTQISLAVGLLRNRLAPGMAYVVNLTSRAERDLAHLYGELNAEHSDAALKWYRGLKEAILSLRKYPNRCPTTRENANFRQSTY